MSTKDITDTDPTTDSDEPTGGGTLVALAERTSSRNSSRDTNDHGTADHDDARDADFIDDFDADAPSRKSTGSSLVNRSISLKAILIGLGGLVVVAALVVASWFAITASNKVDDLNHAAAGRQHAEQVGLNYATGAAQMDYQNLGDWKGRLVAGTSPELTNRLNQAAASMEQIITPLQWTSTSSPITAKVLSESNGVYQVVSFVDVLTKNAQTPGGIESTATYKMTIDSGHNWQITDISGIGSALGTADAGTAGTSAPSPAPAPGK